MTSRTRKFGVGLLAVLSALAFAGSAIAAELRFVQVAASTKEQRSAIVDTGMSIEATRSDSVWGFATETSIAKLKAQGFQLLGEFDYRVGRGGHEGILDFPPEDSKYHNYDRATKALQAMVAANSDIAKLESVGKSVEGRDLWAVHVNTSPDALATGKSNKPGAIYMGNHHAREHLSLEVPLMFAQYLLDNRHDSRISALLDARDIWILPMINPDGAEYDVSAGDYKWWRKNRARNSDGTYGVDLNRNYGYMWNHGGADSDTNSEIYMGPRPFSEPETQAMKAFVEAHLNAKVLLTFHTFSELILYPWGHTYDAIANSRDHDVFSKLATTMAQWNHYKPEQSSALYIASGDTTDWAYGAHGIFAFTFEMSPTDIMDGGFYPGEDMIQKAFNDNLQPCLYLLDVASDPYKVLSNQPTGFLRNYVEPRLDDAEMWNATL